MFSSHLSLIFLLKSNFDRFSISPDFLPVFVARIGESPSMTGRRGSLAIGSRRTCSCSSTVSSGRSPVRRGLPTHSLPLLLAQASDHSYLTSTPSKILIPPELHLFTIRTLPQFCVFSFHRERELLHLPARHLPDPLHVLLHGLHPDPPRPLGAVLPSPYLLRTIMTQLIFIAHWGGKCISSHATFCSTLSALCNCDMH